MPKDPFKDIREKVKREAGQQIQKNYQTIFEFGGDLGFTKRRAQPPVDGSTRDTYDTGLMSRKTELFWDGNKLRAHIDTEYASYVIYGYVTRKGKVIPPRPQILKISLKPINQIIEKELK